MLGSIFDLIVTHPFTVTMVVTLFLGLSCVLLVKQGQLQRAKKPMNIMKRESRELNKKFSKEGLRYNDRQGRAKQGGLRECSPEYTFEMVCSWTENQCYDMFLKYGVFEKGPFHCWVCHSVMTPVDRTVNADLPCSDPQCPGGRCRLSSPREAFTPMYSVAKYPEYCSYKKFMQTCCLASPKIPQDCAIHMFDITPKRLDLWYQDVKAGLRLTSYVTRLVFQDVLYKPSNILSLQFVSLSKISKLSRFKAFHHDSCLDQGSAGLCGTLGHSERDIPSRHLGGGYGYNTHAA